MKSKEKSFPPWLARKVLHWYCSEELLEEIEGDLEERFQDHLEQFSSKKAKRLYWLNVIKFFSWRTVKPRKSYTNQSIRGKLNYSVIMFKNYFKIAIRNAKKHKVYTAINLLGLTLGLTSSILIMLYVNHQLSYDQFHEKKDKIYRVSLYDYAITPNIVGPTLKRTYSEDIQHSMRMAFFGKQIFNYNEEAFSSEMIYADPDFFEVFSFNFLAGDKQNALTSPNSLVVTKKAALSYFGSTDVVNSTIQVAGENFQITGIIEDIPSNSTIQFDFLGSLVEKRWVKKEQWSNAMFHTFLLLPNGLTPAIESKVETHFNKLLEIPDDSEDAVVVNWLSINDLYLKSNLEYEMGNTSSLSGVYIFSSIALLILVMACINYVNLATSRSIERAKEVGMRKVMGAQKRQLYYQFLGESIIYVFSSLIFSFVIILYLLPSFNQLAGVTIEIGKLWSLNFWVGILSLGLIISFLSGFYPAIVLSAYRPVNILKGSTSVKGEKSFLKKGLVVFQFSISTFLLVSTLVIGEQLSFIRSKDLGYEKEQVIYFRINEDLRKNIETFKNQLRSNPQIQAVSFSNSTPLNVGSKGGTKRLDHSKDQFFTTAYLKADESFIELMQMKLLAGRNFLRNDGNFDDLEQGKVPAVVINETMARQLGWATEETINKKINYGKHEVLIVGVIADFHSSSLKDIIEPFMIIYAPVKPYYAFVKLGTDQINETLGFIEDQTLANAPGLPFDFRFLDDQFNRMYRVESRLNRIFFIFSTIAISIAALGILGLVSYMALNREKEISIRKVLGASVQNILTLISSDFLKLVGFALIIALPSSYFIMNNWLSNYAYRITISTETLIYAATASIAITLFTISYQAIKTAFTNPANVLRSE